MYAQSRSCITWTQLKTLVQAWRGHVCSKSVMHYLDTTKNISTSMEGPCNAQSRSCITWTQLKTLVQAWRGHVCSKSVMHYLDTTKNISTSMEGPCMLKVGHALPGHN